MRRKEFDQAVFYFNLPDNSRVGTPDDPGDGSQREFEAELNGVWAHLMLGRWTMFLSAEGRRYSQSGYGAILEFLALYGRDATTAWAHLNSVRLPKTPGWPDKLVMLYRGEIKSAALIAEAKTPLELTEAHTHIGLKSLIADDREEATKHLTWVSINGDRSSLIYDLAAAELKRIK